MRAIALALLVAAAIAAPVRADGGVYRWLRIGGEDAAVGLSEFALKPELAPAHCRWCRSNPLDDAVRDALGWRDPGLSGALEQGLADVLSYGTLAGDAISMVAITASDHRDVAPVVESMSVAALATQAIKFSVGRQRPYARDVELGDDDNLSFVSGHTSIAVAGAVSAGLETHSPWVWGVGLGLAGVTGYLRIAADKHWFTDVLAGAAVGAIAGWAVTKLTYAPQTSSARAFAVPLLSGAW